MEDEKRPSNNQFATLLVVRLLLSFSIALSIVYFFGSEPLTIGIGVGVGILFSMLVMPWVQKLLNNKAE